MRREDPTTMQQTIEATVENVLGVHRDRRCRDLLSEKALAEWVADKGYHVRSQELRERTATWTTAVAGTRACAARDVRESTSALDEAWYPTDAASRRAARTHLRALPGDRRDATSPPARASEHPQALPRACRRLQLEPGDAAELRGRNAARAELLEVGGGAAHARFEG
jgi:hypothetical protein